MKLKTITVGIMSKEDYKNRTMAIVKGEYKPKKDDPKIWFESINLWHKFYLMKIKNF